MISMSVTQNPIGREVTGHGGFLKTGFMTHEVPARNLSIPESTHQYRLPVMSNKKQRGNALMGETVASIRAHAP